MVPRVSQTLQFVSTCMSPQYLPHQQGYVGPTATRAHNQRCRIAMCKLRSTVGRGSGCYRQTVSGALTI